ncbi:MAG: FkbM family methyltransferase, partial [Alphaproteobacteria bacterium]|nr:FkbM family methyltransferase [Alphaproteobacteria bacterium]
RGDIIAWLNSDDVFASPDVFKKVIDRFNAPDAPDIVYGKGIYINETGETLRDVYINKNPETLPWRLQQEDGILQPALFMRRSVIEDVGELTGSRHYCMDYEYWIRCVAAGKTFAYVDENFALARYHNNNKTYGQRGNSYAEVCDMLVAHFGYANHTWLRRYAEFLSDGFDGVLAHGQNSDIADTAILDGIYRKLLMDYNGSKLVLDHLAANASAKGYGDTLREMQRLGIGPSVPCMEVRLETTSKRGQSLYTVGPRRWAFDAGWKQRELEKAHAFIQEQANNRQSEVCVIVGNGPSLKKANLDLLAGHDVIISNNAFLDKRLKELATYYTVVNYLVAEQSAHNINRLGGLAKILPYWTGYCLNPGEDTHFIEAVGHAAFSKDIFKNASWRHTVTFFNMHIAFGLGYKRAVLIGFDHSYKQQAGVKEGDVIVSHERDENHFDSSYFQGKKWQAADVGMMEQMYLLARQAYAEEGRELINATVGGALEVLPRMDLADALAMKPLPEAALTEAKAAGKRSMAKHIRAVPRERHAQVDETSVVARLLAARKGDDHIMVDVGAHVGTSAQCFHDLGWSIHCFEPDAKNRAMVCERFGEARNVRIDTRAVSDVAAKGVSFFTSPQSTGISGLHAFHDSHVVSDPVEVTTVADVVADRNLSRIDFLKIDVEGFDLNVLKGVPWDRLKPDVVECEFEDAKTLKLGHDWKDIAEYLSNLGYAVYVSEWHPIIRYGIPHDWHRVAPYQDHEMPDDAWGNILAFQKDPGYPALASAFDELMEFRVPLPDKRPIKSANGNDAASAVGTKPGSPTRPDRPTPKSVSQMNTESKASMLKQMPDTSLPIVAADPQKSVWYVDLAHRIHRASPRLYNLIRFLRRAALHGVSRPMLALPLAILGTAILVAAFSADLAAYRPWTFTGLGFGVLATLLAYTAFRSQGHAESLHQEVGAIRGEVKGLSGRLPHSFVKIHDKLLTIDARTASIERDALGTARALDDIRAVNSVAQSKIDTLEANNKELKTRIARLETLLGPSGQVETIRKDVVGKVDSLNREVSDKFTTAETAVKSVEGKLAVIDKWAQFDNATWYQHFNRRLTNDQIVTLESEWRKRLSVPISRAVLGYMANRACEIERQLDGRLATSVEDILLRSLVARAVKGPKIDVLEIGTLFGVGAGVMFDALANHYEEVHFTLLDPLEGYYNVSQADILTGQRIDERTLRRNLQRVGMTEDQFTLIKKLSTDNDAIKAASERQYDLLVIDADHSYAGVKADFENYARYVKLGGYIIFDDYGSADWPDVQEYVDSEISSVDFIARVGASWRTCVYRIVKNPAA